MYGQNPVGCDNAETQFADIIEIEGNGADHDSETGEEKESLDGGPPTGGAAPPHGPNELPEHLLNPPGLVGNITNWITDTAIYPQPALSIGAALTIVGTAAGRRFAGPTRSGTHLYVAVLAPSGAGKDHPRSRISTILHAAGMDGCIGPAEFMSSSAVYLALAQRPTLLCPMDEFGAFLKRIGSHKATGFEAAIPGTLRTAWGSSFQYMLVPAWATKKLDRIAAPALSIYGPSTHAEYYGALKGADIINGVLNRFVLIEVWTRPEERIPTVDPNKVPGGIVDGLRRIFVPGLSKLPPDGPGGIPDYETLSITAEAEVIRKALVKEVQAKGDADAALEPFLARTAENAIRVATILALGCGRMTVEAGDMIWARDFMVWSAKRMVEGAALYIADTETQALANEVKRVLKAKGGKRVPGWVLKKALEHKYRRKDLDEVLISMAETRTIQKEIVLSSVAGGRPAIFYTLRG